MEGACDAENMGHSVNIKLLGAAGYAIFQLSATCSPCDTSLVSCDTSQDWEAQSSLQTTLSLFLQKPVQS